MHPPLSLFSNSTHLHTSTPLLDFCRILMHSTHLHISILNVHPLHNFTKFLHYKEVEIKESYTFLTSTNLSICIPLSYFFQILMDSSHLHISVHGHITLLCQNYYTSHTSQYMATSRYLSKIITHSTHLSTWPPSPYFVKIITHPTHLTHLKTWWPSPYFVKIVTHSTHLTYLSTNGNGPHCIFQVTALEWHKVWKKVKSLDFMIENKCSWIFAMWKIPKIYMATAPLLCQNCYTFYTSHTSRCSDVWDVWNL